MEIPNTFVHEHVWKNLSQWADKTALVHAPSERRYTFQKVRDWSKNLAGFLRSNKVGAKQGDVIAIHLPSIPEYAIAVLASLEAGLVITTINPLISIDDTAKILKDTEAKVLVTMVETVFQAADAMRGLPKQLPIVSLTFDKATTPSGCTDFLQICQGSYPEVTDLKPLKFDDTVFYVHTGGSEGSPKRVTLSKRNILAYLTLKINFDNKVKDPKVSAGDVVTNVLMFSIAGIIRVLSSILLGVKVIVVPTFKTEHLLTALRTFQPQVLYTLSNNVSEIIYHPLSAKPDTFKTVDEIEITGGPVGPKEWERLKQKFGPEKTYTLGYGLTETTGPFIFHLNLKPKDSNPVRKFYQLNPECQVRDVETGKPIEKGQWGELYVKGAIVMKGYHKATKAQAKALDDQGWLKTGDYAAYDDKGMIQISNSIKDLIKVDGIIVPPVELEDILKSHPSVANAVVIGYPHNIQGEIPRAFIVAKSDAEVNTKEIKEFVDNQVKKHQKLGGIMAIDVIPLNLSGKVNKQKLLAKIDKENKK